MKGKIKHRFLAIVLCVAMIVTSVNLTNLFDNNFNAANTYTLTVNPNGGTWRGTTSNTSIRKSTTTENHTHTYADSEAIYNANPSAYCGWKTSSVCGAGVSMRCCSNDGNWYDWNGSCVTWGYAHPENVFCYNGHMCLDICWNGWGASLTDNTCNYTVTTTKGPYCGKTEGSTTVYPTENIENPTRPGYTFSGWTKSGSGSFSRSTYTYGDGNGTLKANWTANSYRNTLNYNANGGSGAPSSQTASVTYPNTQSTFTVSTSKPTAYSKTGYTVTFAGWYDAATGGNKIGTTITVNTANATSGASKTLYAHWTETKNKYTVTYIDIVQGTTTELGRTTVSVDYGTTVRGADKGNSTTLSAYYTNYIYVSDTSATVTTSGATVYRYFKLGVTNYTVKHFQLNNDGINYTEVTTDRQTLSGIIGSSVTPSVKSYTGFTSPSTQTVTIAADGTTVVNYYYTRNKYTVTYIDVVDSTSGKQLGSSTDSLYYGVTATGATKGTNAADNYYYNGYYYNSCTTATVGTSGATVYRIFKLRTIDINGSVNWNDKSNAYSSRPNNVTIYLYRNGQQIDTYTGLTGNDNNTFSFKNLQKYDTSTGAAYVYTVSQSDVKSLNSPEDQYTTTVDTTGLNFTNILGNTKQDNPNPEWVGFEVNGSILWDDYNDKFGTRPSEITLTLYRNNVPIKTQVVDKTATGYSFVNLDKYDDDLNPYTYKVEETFTAKVLTWDSTTKQYEEIDAYTITVDGFDFTNTLVDTKDKPIIQVKPDHSNTLTIKLGFNSIIDWSNIETTSSNVEVFVRLKQLETVINNGNISYTSNYSGMEYNVVVKESGITINGIPSGKYEIVANNNTFVLEGIDLQTSNSISVVNENGKWYLIIAETNQNQTGTITLNMNTENSHGSGSANGYISSMSKNNYYSLRTISPMQVMMLSMFSDEVTVPEYVEPTTYTITYKECDVEDNTKYSENSEATLKDCDIENFLGWSEDSEATESQYLAGDVITIDKDFTLYPVIKSLESTEEETSEEIESEEQEEILETENTSEEKTSESEESTEDVETVTEEESSETHEESSEAEETETESSETIESEEPLKKNSAFSE